MAIFASQQEAAESSLGGFFNTLTHKRLYLLTYPFKKQEVWDLISLWWKTLPTVSQQGANPQQVCVFFRPFQAGPSSGEGVSEPACGMFL